MVLPTRTLQGEEAPQFAPMLRTVADAVSVRVFGAEPPPPAWTLHVFELVQIKTFWPGGLLKRTYTAPAEQLVGRNVPACAGLVFGAAEKSTSRPWLCRLICVCDHATAAVTPRNMPRIGSRYFPDMKSISSEISSHSKLTPGPPNFRASRRARMKATFQPFH